MKKIILLLSLLIVFIFVGCKKDDGSTSPTNVDCSTQLETASRCKAILPKCSDSVLKTSVRCLGTNSDGKTRCSKKTLSPCGYCNIHENQYDGQCPNETNNACGYCDEHKDQYSGE